MKNLKIGLKLLGGFTTVTLIAVLLGGIGVLAIQQLSTDLDRLGFERVPGIVLAGSTGGNSYGSGMDDLDGEFESY